MQYTFSMYTVNMAEPFKSTDHPPDMLVIGAGLAGLAAANRALELGLRVTLLERQRNRSHVCASRTNGGVFHVGFRSVTMAREELFEVIRTINEGFGDVAVARALADNAARSVEWLQSFGIEFTKLVPDHGWKDRVLAPVGFHDKTTMAWQGLGADRLIDTLEERFIDGGGEVIRGRRAESLLVDGNRVRGVAFSDDAGTEHHHAAAIVLADGGFEGNEAYIRKYITPHPENLLLRGYASGFGDGMRMAAGIGADLTGMESFYGHLLSADSLHRQGLSPFPFLDFLASAGMLVDKAGERFVDETAGGHFASNALARHAEGLGYVIFDHGMWEGIGRHFFSPPNPNLVDAGGTLHRADSLHQLAHKIDIPTDRLTEQAAQLNAEVRERTGSLDDTATRARMTEYAKGRHQHEPFASAPYYAAPVCAALTSTLGGIAIDCRARALRKSGEFIPGLYAAGSVTGGIEGGPAVGYVGGLIKALVFGLIAAEHAASAE